MAVTFRFELFLIISDKQKLTSLILSDKFSFKISLNHSVKTLLQTSICKKNKMSRVARRPVFGVSDQVRHKLGCTATEDG